ncbi:PhzF family phenazine biosynthesis protein [Nocardiopsis coralliicola]
MNLDVDSPTIPRSLDLYILRVFTAPDGSGGNLLGVVPDGAALPDQSHRAALAARLGFSETIYIDPPLPAEGAAADAPAGRGVDIHTPGTRLDFAGHPLLGAAWLLRRAGQDAAVLHPPAGPVPTWEDEGPDGPLRLRARPEWAAGRRTEQYRSPEAVDALPSPPPGEGWLYSWAWLDESAGEVRARGFPRRPGGVAEDEATGAAALVLASRLNRPLTIRQGRSSVIATRPGPDGTVDLSGRVAFAEKRTLTPAGTALPG